MDNIESRREFLRKAPLRLAGACAVMSEVPEACARVVSDRVFEFLHDEGAVPFLEKIAVPSGLRRVWVPKGSFGEWMRQLPVKQRNNGIFDKDGKRVFGSEMAHSIVDMDVWRYQECADVAMRLWGNTSMLLINYIVWICGWKMEAEIRNLVLMIAGHLRNIFFISSVMPVPGF